MNYPLKVLCVDDNPDTADTTAHLLWLAGFETRSCYSAFEALAAAEEFGPDVCVLDLGMPGMDGGHLALHLRDWMAGKELRLIALTGRRDSETSRHVRTCGFDDHLVKPSSPDRLIAAVHGQLSAA